MVVFSNIRVDIVTVFLNSETPNGLADRSDNFHNKKFKWISNSKIILVIMRIARIVYTLSLCGAIIRSHWTCVFSKNFLSYTQVHGSKFRCVFRCRENWKKKKRKKNNNEN